MGSSLADYARTTSSVRGKNRLWEITLFSISSYAIQGHDGGIFAVTGFNERSG